VSNRKLKKSSDKRVGYNVESSSNSVDNMIGLRTGVGNSTQEIRKNYKSQQPHHHRNYNGIVIPSLQRTIQHHQNSQENLKIEDQDQLHAINLNKRRMRSRNAAIKQSLSQNTANLDY